MHGDRHNPAISNPRTWERFFVLALQLYNWPMDFARQQCRFWMGGVRDIRVHDSTLCLMEMTESNEDLLAIVRRHRTYRGW